MSRFKIGDPVKVRAKYPPGHARSPWFTRGHRGRIVQVAGPYANAEELAYGRPGAPEPLYRVRFRQQELWPDYRGATRDTLVVDIYEHWLVSAERT